MLEALVVVGPQDFLQRNLDRRRCDSAVLADVELVEAPASAGRDVLLEKLGQKSLDLVVADVLLWLAPSEYAVGLEQVEVLAEDVSCDVDLDMVVSCLLSAAHVRFGIGVRHIEDGLAGEICLSLVQRCLLFLVENDLSVYDLFDDVGHVLNVAVKVDI